MGVRWSGWEYHEALLEVSKHLKNKSITSMRVDDFRPRLFRLERVEVLGEIPDKLAIALVLLVEPVDAFPR